MKVTLLFVAGILIGGICVLFWPESLSFIQRSSVKEFISTIAPAAGWFSATAAIIAIWWNVRRAKYNLSIDLILKLGERFEKPEMRAIRSKAANALITDPETEDGHVADVLNFFEEVDFLLRRNAIDADAAWSFFYEWVYNYYHATSNYREAQNYERATPFHDGFERLYDSLTEIEVKEMIENGTPKHNALVKPPVVADLKYFLEGEIELLGKRVPFRLTNRRL